MPQLNTHPFEALSPDLLIDAVESQGFVSDGRFIACLLYTSPSPRDATLSRMPSSA